MTYSQKWLVYTKQFIFAVGFLQALEWTYQKIKIIKNLTKFLDNKKVDYCHLCTFSKAKNPKKAICQLKDEEFTFSPSCISHSKYQISLVWREHEKQIKYLNKMVLKEISIEKNYWGKVLFIAGAKIDLEEKETIWKRVRESYRFLEKQINGYIGQISGGMTFLENCREVVGE